VFTRWALQSKCMLTPMMSGTGFQKLCHGLQDFTRKLLGALTFQTCAGEHVSCAHRRADFRGVFGCCPLRSPLRHTRDQAGGVVDSIPMLIESKPHTISPTRSEGPAEYPSERSKGEQADPLRPSRAH
jgi:hypothetical protein